MGASYAINLNVKRLTIVVAHLPHISVFKRDL
jgi:hypothetical protein